MKQLWALFLRRVHTFEAVMGIIIKEGPYIYLKQLWALLLRMVHIFEAAMGIIIKGGPYI